MILAHNHPSGAAEPSPADYAATEMIWKALDAVGVELRDHIIVAGGRYLSMRQAGFL